MLPGGWEAVSEMELPPPGTHLHLACVVVPELHSPGYGCLCRSTFLKLEFIWEGNLIASS